MNLKKIIVGIFFISVCLVYYKYSLNRFRVKENPEEKVEDSSSQIINVPQSLKVTENNHSKVKVYETKDQKFDSYDEMESNWLNIAKDFLGESNYITYLNLREGCDKEKELAYKAYHDYLRAKNGNNFKYNISEDQSIHESKINEKYQKQLLKLIGEEKFKKYLILKDEFNENLRKKSNGKNVISIEF